MKCDVGTGRTSGPVCCIHLMSNSGSPVPPLLNYIKVYNNNDLRYRKKKTDARIYEVTSFALRAYDRSNRQPECRESCSNRGVS